MSQPSPEFTLKGVVLGLAIGCLLCFTNLYFGLQTGWISMMSLQSALIGFLISKMLPTPLAPHELIVVQTTAVATGTIPLAAGFVGILPALSLLEPERDNATAIDLSWAGAVAWSCSIAFFGVFLSPPIRKQVIIREKLPFPSGTATAQLISVLYDMPPPKESSTTLRRRRPVDDPEHRSLLEDQEGLDYGMTVLAPASSSHGWKPLGWSFIASSAVTLAAYFAPVVFAFPLFGLYLARNWAWTVSGSLSYVGQGVIMGFPTTLSMNLGMLVGWAVLSPLCKISGWAPAPVTDMQDGARGWLLWVALAIMFADSIISLIPVGWEYLTRFRDASVEDEDANDEAQDRLVPTSWVVSGVVGSIIIGTVLVYFVFGREGIHPWATISAFILGGLLSILGVRALGETDINPVSGLGKISQLFFAWVQPGNVVANIIAGGVAEAGAQQAGDLMQDLKTGHLCGASPRAQFYGQIVGSSVSILVTATAYSLYKRTYQIPGPEFPAPSAYVWLSLARLLRDGDLPEKSGLFMTIFALLFGFIAAIKMWASRSTHSYWARIAPYIPSGVAFAIGFLTTPSFSIARFLGGLLDFYYRRRLVKLKPNIHLIIVASGFVLGEGVISILSLALRHWGVSVLTCWGCSHGMCAGCPAA
ncbi:oligopeptide transporter [Fistulina hepatica ATCC 64428]|nr:oligopeptide transporter [Fistulina hepatica ATCC 64428]